MGLEARAPQVTLLVTLKLGLWDLEYVDYLAEGRRIPLCFGCTLAEWVSQQEKSSWVSPRS